MCLYFVGLTHFLSCQNDEAWSNTEPVETQPANTEQTLLIYMPWCSELVPYFENNIKDMEKAVATGFLENQRIVVFFSIPKRMLFCLNYVIRKANV